VLRRPEQCPTDLSRFRTQAGNSWYEVKGCISETANKASSTLAPVFDRDENYSWNASRSAERKANVAPSQSTDFIFFISEPVEIFISDIHLPFQAKT